MTAIRAEQAAELYADGEGEDGDTAGPWTLVGPAQGHKERQSRWHQRYWLVMRNVDGDLWGLSYGLGLTEYQENNLPWSEVPDDRHLPLTQLHPHEVTKTVYRTKPAEVTA